MIRWKHLWGPEVQTPSYILSPLDSGPQNISLECPISFSPFLPFGTLGNTAGDSGVFFIARTDNIRYSQIVIRDSDDGVWKPLKTVFKIFEQKKDSNLWLEGG